MAIGRRYDFYEKTAAGARAIFAFVVICGVVSGESLLLGQTVPQVVEHACSTTLLEEPEGCVVTLSPGETKNLSLAVPQGKVRMLIAEQTSERVAIRLPAGMLTDAGSSAPDPFTNSAGLHSKINVLISAGSPDGVEVGIENISKANRPAVVLISLSAESVADTASKDEQTAEMAFSHAVFLINNGTAQPNEILVAFDTAIAIYQQAGKKQQLEQALIWKANYLIYHNLPAAVPLSKQALELIASLDRAEAANCWRIAGMIDAFMAQYDSASDAYQNALTISQETGDPINQEMLLENLAKIQRMQGKTELALKYEMQASDLASNLEDPVRLLGVQDELGLIYYELGDLESSYVAYEHALSLLTSVHNPLAQGVTWTDASELFMRIGDFDRARDALEQAASIWKSSPNPLGELNTLTDLGELYLENGQIKNARHYLELGQALAEKESIDRIRAALLSEMGKSYLLEGNVPLAIQNLESSLFVSRKIHQEDQIGDTLCLLGDAGLRGLNLSTAKQNYGDCRAHARSEQDLYLEILAEGGLARAAFQSSELDTALEHSETALSKIESIRGNIKQQDLKTTFFASLHSYYDLEIQILAAMDRVHPNEGYSWKAFLVAERARARTLLDEVAATNKDPQASPALLAQYDDVRRRLRQLETSSSHPHAPGTSRTQAKTARLSMEEHALHAEIAKDGATTAAPDIKPLTLMSLQTALPDAHAALIEYWTGEDASYAWSTTRSGIQFFRLPPAAQLNQLINGFRRAVFAMVPSDPKITAEQRVVSRTAAEGQQHRLGLRLMKMLFPIGMLHPAASTVLIVGDGAIHSLPFAALPDQAARQSQSPRRIVFINEPSATLFAALTSGSIAPHSLRAAIFMANDAAHVEQVRSSFVLLPFAANEAETIRTILGANATRIFTGPAASAEAMRNLDWHDFSIGHFATHAVLNAQYAELTGLQLGKDSTAQSTASQMLWYGDILRMRARLDLVVLSACETALGKDVPGEGLVGLTQAFFTAGSQRVVGTLWQVDDQATSEWMRHFYQSLKKTRSPATALHDAQKAMAADPQWSAPYYWAGFVLAGDWRPLP